MDLPTYTNIWRIEKRLYKLYDFRLPAPLPITWIGVFVGITVPYVVFLIAIGLPFNHNLVWLYVLPPGVLTWLTTRPVIESKRLPELVSSQLRYVAEPRSWCRMAPFAEKDDILVTARVWHQHPPKARPKRARRTLAAARASAAAPEQAAPEQVESAPQAAAAPETAATEIVARPVKARRAAAPPLESAQPSVSQPAAVQPSASQLAVSPPPVSPATQPPAAKHEPPSQPPSQPLPRQPRHGPPRPRPRHRRLLRGLFHSERQPEQSPAEARSREPGRAARGLAKPSPRYGRPRQAAMSALSLPDAPRGFRRGPQVRMTGPSRSRTTLDRGRATSASPVASSRSPPRHGRRSGPVPSPCPVASPRPVPSPRLVPSRRPARSPRPACSPSPGPFPRQRPLPPSLPARPNRRAALLSGLSRRRGRLGPGLAGSCGLSPLGRPHPPRPPLSPPHRWNRPRPLRRHPQRRPGSRASDACLTGAGRGRNRLFRRLPRQRPPRLRRPCPWRLHQLRPCLRRPLRPCLRRLLRPRPPRRPRPP